MSKHFRIITVLFVLIHHFACNQQEKNNHEGTPKIDFNHTEFDFGTVKMGEKLIHDFVFKNSGDGNLFIKNIKTDCGCTAAKFNKKAIKPKEESSIEVVFSSEGFPGFQTKKVTVFPNVGDSIVLTLAAVVDFEMIEN